MNSIKSALAQVRTPQGAGTVKSLLAGLAIAWGWRTAMGVAQDATERAEQARTELDALTAELDNAHHTLSERLIESIRLGYCDAAVKARAAALGWAEPIDVPDVAPEN